jgi:MYXO-CTERM domain-containing protein
MHSKIASLLPNTAALASLLVIAGCGPMEPLQLAGELPGISGKQQPIVNGKEYNGHPSVGRIVIRSSSGYGASCTGTLIGKHTVLTAAHCVYPNYTHEFRMKTGTYTTNKVVRHPAYSGSSSANNDIGLMHLNDDPPITPSGIARKPPFVGQKITIIGYGITQTGLRDSGVKRIGYNTVAAVTSTRFQFNGAGGDLANTCSGDSGGPAFAFQDGVEVHLGIHSLASRPCGARGYNTRTDVYVDWVNTQSGGDIYVPKPDTQPPKVAITSPVDKASVHQDFTVQVTATDDAMVDTVELLMDGNSLGKKNGGDQTFQVNDAAAGQHTLKAIARDGAGNQAETQISVTAVPPKSFGERCAEHLDCQSELCAADPAFNYRYCSKLCKLDSNDCPTSSDCLPVDGVNFLLCGLPADTEGGNVALDGGCSVAPSSSPAPLSPLMLLALVGLLARRRR